MITLKTVCRVVAAAITNDRACRAIFDRYPNPPKVFVGISGDKPTENLNGVALFVYPSETKSYDIGHKVVDRSPAVSVRFQVYDQATREERYGTVYEAAESADDLAQAIVAAVKSITGFGDELATAEYALNASEFWPVATGQIDMVFECRRGTDFEPELTE